MEITDFEYDSTLITCTGYFNGALYEFHFENGKLVNSFSQPTTAKNKLTAEEYKTLRVEADKKFKEKFGSQE